MSRPEPAQLTGARLAELPTFVEPQLATPVTLPPDGEQWLHEIKLDGYRLQCRLDGKDLRLLSRRGLQLKERLAPLGERLSLLPASQAVIDGEVVVLLENGASSLAALQEALSAGEGGRLCYFAFDLLYLDGWDLRRAPLLERKSLLERLVGEVGLPELQLCEHLIGQGPLFFRSACAMALEGVVSKRHDAPYRSGRGKDWLKARCVQRQDFVICGFTPSTTGSRGISALVLGHLDQGELRYAGRVGTGFGEATSLSLRALLEPLRRETPPCRVPSEQARGVRWVRPEQVCDVEFLTWSREGRLRHPSFMGLKDIALEAGTRTAESGEQVALQTGRAGPEREEEEPDRIAGVLLTHPERLLYPEAGLTKRGLAEYYQAVAEWLLPHLAGRPLSLLRCPAGQGGECFFQKKLPFPAGKPAAPRQNFEGTLPAGRRRSQGLLGDPSGDRQGSEQRLVRVDDLAGLVALVQLGVLELHPWGCREDDLERPDRMIFDLDPHRDVDWSEVIRAAEELRERLARCELQSFVKLTGGKGLHVVVPLERVHTWAEVRAFSRELALAMARDSPSRYTLQSRLAEREGRIYLDVQRKGRGATAVAPCSTRAHPAATVAAPLHWNELSPLVRSDHFTVARMMRRLSVLQRDPWAELPGLRQRLPGIPR